MEENIKKPRRFLKMLGKVGEIIAQEAILKILRGVVNRIGGKKNLPSILFLFLSISLFAQYPATGNKQRLGYQTTGDGLVFRGRSSDTTALKPSTINNAYFVLDTVNNVLYNYIKTKGGWVFNNADTVINNITIDTTSLSNRINLKLNISDTASMLTPYFRDSDTTSLNLTSRFAAKLNISDTASMLTNYLRTGVAASTYQTILTNPITGTGTTNYLPKFTGTIILGSSGLFRDVNRFSINEGTDQSFGWDFMGNTSNPFIGNNVKASTTYERVERMASTTLFNPAAIIFGFQRVNNSSGATSYGGMNFMTTSGNLSGDINPITYSRMFIEPDGNIGIGTMQPSYKFDIRGTLGVTGATTLSAPLTVNSSSVFNEGSTDADFRVESDGNVNMVFVDASTDRVGIGTNTPSKTLEVNGTINATGDITEGGLNVLTSADTASLSSRIDGKVSLTATESISGTKTFNNLVNLTSNLILSGSYSQTNKLLGKNSSDGVGNITVGSGLNLTSDILTATNPTERYYFDLGIVAGAADNSASTYDFTYGSNIFIVPTSLNGYCIDTVHIRAIGCSTCPPVAGDKDYYVGVYKANAGARVTTSGATLVGSQITMNEYDLNEVNRNDTLSTGEAWWVYLNGTYTSDMAYVTAGFIVKKTCN